MPKLLNRMLDMNPRICKLCGINLKTRQRVYCSRKCLIETKPAKGR